VPYAAALHLSLLNTRPVTRPVRQPAGAEAAAPVADPALEEPDRQAA